MLSSLAPTFSKIMKGTRVADKRKFKTERGTSTVRGECQRAYTSFLVVWFCPYDLWWSAGWYCKILGTFLLHHADVGFFHLETVLGTHNHVEYIALNESTPLNGSSCCVYCIKWPLQCHLNNSFDPMEACTCQELYPEKAKRGLRPVKNHPYMPHATT